jgi:TonB-dependent receptor
MIRLVLLSLLLFPTSMGFAQTGSLSGKVTSNGTAEELIGATIILVQEDGKAPKGTVTDLDGNYTLSGLPIGSHQFICRYIGFHPDTLSVAIKADERTTLRFALIDESVKMEDFVIVAKQNRGGINVMDLMKQKSATLIEGTTREQFARTGDNNASGALKRVTGVSVEGGKYIYVRGLSDRYSITTLNGAEIPGLDPNRNTVQMDLFPTSLIENITVVKSFSPELPGSFTGGLVNIETRDFPEEFTLQFSTSLGFNPQSNLRHDFLTYEGGKTDGLGFDDGSRSAPSATNGYIPSRYESATANQELSAITRSFNKTMTPETKSSMFDQRYSFAIGNQIDSVFGKQLGFVAGLTYSKQYDFYSNGTTGRYKLTGHYNNTDSLNVERYLTDTKGSESVLWGGLINLSYKLSPHHKVSANFIRNQNGISSSRTLEGIIPEDAVGLYFQTRTLQYLQRSLTSGQLRGEHYFENLKKLNTNWTGSYTISTQDEPDLRFFSNDYTLSGTDETDTIYDIQPAIYGDPSRYFRTMKESNFDVKLNFELPFSSLKTASEDNSAIKWGISNVSKEREFGQKRYDLESTGLEYNGSISEFLSDENMEVGSPEGYVFVVDATEERNSYNGSQQVFGAYGMVDFYPTQRLRLISGVRMERTSIETYSLNPELDRGILEATDFLPAINAVYVLNSNDSIKTTKAANLRFAYSRTLARPTFRELAPFASFDFIGDNVIVGNPKLNRTLVDNIDLRWEVFPTAGDIVSVSLFGKRFLQPIERTFNPVAVNAELNYRNVDEALVAGAELEVRKSLRFISEKLAPVSTGLNLTYIYSSVSIDPAELVAIRANIPQQSDTRMMFGQSPYLVNAFINYRDTSGWNSNLSFNVSGPKLAIIGVGGTPDVIEQPRAQLDFSLSKNLNKRFGIGLRIRNILNADYKLLQTYKEVDYVYQQYTIGRSFSISLKYTAGGN